MIRSQVIVLQVFFDDGDEDPYVKKWGEKTAPESWKWDEIIDEPVRGQTVLAAGPVVDYPTPEEARDGAS